MGSSHRNRLFTRVFHPIFAICAPRASQGSQAAGQSKPTPAHRTRHGPRKVRSNSGKPLDNKQVTLVLKILVPRLKAAPYPLPPDRRSMRPNKNIFSTLPRGVIALILLSQVFAVIQNHPPLSTLPAPLRRDQFLEEGRLAPLADSSLLLPNSRPDVRRLHDSHPNVDTCVLWRKQCFNISQCCTDSNSRTQSRAVAIANASRNHQRHRD